MAVARVTAKRFCGVGEGVGGGEAGGGEQGGDACAGEFVTVFGVDGFAGGEVQGEGGSGGGGGDVDLLGREGFEVHLDARFGGVPDGRGGGSWRRSKLASSSRLRRVRTLRLKAAVTPAASL